MTELTALPQLEIEIKFYLGQTAQNIIEVGKRLIQAKSLVQHGQWQNWLQNNFQLSHPTATKFMNCAVRFSNVASMQGLNSTQMIQLLSLPDAEETEKFIEQKAAEGKKVADMTIKELREEIAGYKKTIEKNNAAHQQSLFDLNEQLAEMKREHGAVRPSAIIEYKNYNAVRQDYRKPQYLALEKVSTRADLPFFVVHYSSDFKRFCVVAINAWAKVILRGEEREMSELQYVTFLYRIRDLSVPPNVIDEIKAREFEGNFF